MLGTGAIGMRHLRVLSEFAHVETMAVPRRAERRAELKAQGIRVAASLSETLPVDGIIIASDTAEHVAHLRQAMDTGASAILVEKPLASSQSDLDGLLHQLSDIERRRTPRVFVGCCLRFDPGLTAFGERIRRSAIGQIHAVEIACRSFLPDWRPGRDYRQTYSARAAEGGVLLDLIHEVDYALWFFGLPKRVFAHLSHSGRLAIESEDQASLFWTCGTTHISIALDYLSRTPARRMSAYGSEGAITWDAVARSVYVEPAGAAEPEILPVGGLRDDMYVEQARAFLTAVTGGDAGPLATGLEGVHALAVCDAARGSSQTGRMEPVYYREME